LAAEEEEEKLSEVFVRAGKVYLFVMALIFLGTGFKPLIDAYRLKLPSQILFWVNMVSAILDNATLAAAESEPSLSVPQIKNALLGLLISGGMLIPGNIPNIIAAHALHITSTEWARLGVPLGLIIMAGTAALLGSVLYRKSQGILARRERKEFASIFFAPRAMRNTARVVAHDHRTATSLFNRSDDTAWRNRIGEYVLRFNLELRQKS